MTTNRKTVQDDRDVRSGGKHRGHGEGALYWSEERQRWVGEVTVGYRPDGKRIVRKGRGKTKAEAQRKLKELLRDHEDGPTLSADAGKYTVAEAAEELLSIAVDWCGQATTRPRRMMRVGWARTEASMVGSVS